jgi:hypothetical protein
VLTLADLIAPHTLEVVGSDVFVAPGERSRFSGVLTVEGFEALVAAAPAAHLDVIRGGIGRAAEAVPELAALAAEKASLRVRRIQLLAPAVMELALSLHRDLREELNVNAYWSPPGADLGLAPHTDGYDVLVLQIAGVKRWWIEGRPELDLAAGEVLFLPARLRHHAATPGVEASLHLTVGIHTKTERSLLEYLATEAGRDAQPFALGGADYAAGIERVRARVASLLAGDDAVERFLAYREGVEVERIYASLEDHERTSARRYR